jgi:hypothetical protein
MYDTEKAIMTTGTETECYSGGKTDTGLYLCHAYTVLGAYKLESGERLIKVRNPHGHDAEEHDGGYKGRWHDNDPNWTDELLALVDHEPKNDGVFIIDEAQFYTSFTETWINPSTLNWHQDYFLKLRDENKNPSYTLTVTNKH